MGPQAGQRVLLLPGDIEPAQQCRDIVTATVDAFGGIDILVNNAAISEGRTTIAEMDDAFWERTFAVNVHSLFYTTKAAAAVMEPGSVIINTSSEAAKSPMPQYAPYAATKAAVMNMTLSLAQMLISQGIRVNAVLPGSTWTPVDRDRRRRRRTETGRRRPDRSTRPTRRARTLLRDARLRREQLPHRHPARRQRREVDAVVEAARWTPSAQRSANGQTSRSLAGRRLSATCETATPRQMCPLGPLAAIGSWEPTGSGCPQ